MGFWSEAVPVAAPREAVGRGRGTHCRPSAPRCPAAAHAAPLGTQRGMLTAWVTQSLAEQHLATHCAHREMRNAG